MKVSVLELKVISLSVEYVAKKTGKSKIKMYELGLSAPRIKEFVQDPVQSWFLLI